jgi:hypothetical protein
MDLSHFEVDHPSRGVSRMSGCENSLEVPSGDEEEEEGIVFMGIALQMELVIKRQLFHIKVHYCLKITSGISVASASEIY